MDKNIKKREARIRRHKRIRKKVHGTAERPRLCVFRSNKHIYAQIIDDEDRVTLVSASSLDKEVISQLDKNATKKTVSRIVGKVIAKRALEKGIENVVFDRGGYLYHGRVKELAEGARENGLKF